MKSLADMSVVELAAFISTHLRKCGIEVVLSGGSCVSIYSGGRYVSKDLDFIDTRFATRREIRNAMDAIGFTPQNRFFQHPDVEFVVEFPSGPPAVGKEPIGEIAEMTVSTGVLRILSPTDCVKDRLAAYYHWKDRESLEQAVAVAETVDDRSVRNQALVSERGHVRQHSCKSKSDCAPRASVVHPTAQSTTHRQSRPFTEGRWRGLYLLSNLHLAG